MGKRAKSCAEGDDALATADDLVGCTGKEQSAVKLSPRVYLVRQILCCCKHHNTFKVLVGISPGEEITSVSELWGGRVSDQTIAESSR